LSDGERKEYQADKQDIRARNEAELRQRKINDKALKTFMALMEESRAMIEAKQDRPQESVIGHYKLIAVGKGRQRKEYRFWSKHKRNKGVE